MVLALIISPRVGRYALPRHLRINIARKRVAGEGAHRWRGGGPGGVGGATQTGGVCVQDRVGGATHTGGGGGLGGGHVGGGGEDSADAQQLTTSCPPMTSSAVLRWMNGSNRAKWHFVTYCTMRERQTVS